MQSQKIITTIVRTADKLDHLRQFEESDKLYDMCKIVETAQRFSLATKAESELLAMAMFNAFIEKLPNQTRYAISNTDIDEIRVQTAGLGSEILEGLGKRVFRGLGEFGKNIDQDTLKTLTDINAAHPGRVHLINENGDPVPLQHFTEGAASTQPSEGGSLVPRSKGQSQPSEGGSLVPRSEGQPQPSEGGSLVPRSDNEPQPSEGGSLVPRSDNEPQSNEGWSQPSEGGSQPNEGGHAGENGDDVIDGTFGDSYYPDDYDPNKQKTPMWNPNGHEPYPEKPSLQQPSVMDWANQHKGALGLGAAALTGIGTLGLHALNERNSEPSPTEGSVLPTGTPTKAVSPTGTSETPTSVTPVPEADNLLQYQSPTWSPPDKQTNLALSPINRPTTQYYMGYGFDILKRQEESGQFNYTLAREEFSDKLRASGQSPEYVQSVLNVFDNMYKKQIYYQNYMQHIKEPGTNGVPRTWDQASNTWADMETPSK